MVSPRNGKFLQQTHQRLFNDHCAPVVAHHEEAKVLLGTAQQDTFIIFKKRLTSAEVMDFYNPDAETDLIMDSSPIGLGAILSQKQADGNFRPFAYGSNALSPVQQQYSQTEQEALAVLWSCHHFHHYVYDHHVTIITDHKPLLQTFSSKSQPPPRIQ